jgi:hypothetical protein
MMDAGWLEPPNPQVAADYWVTRRSSDAAWACDLGLPEIRVRYRWDGQGAWMTGDHYEATQWREPVRVLLPLANGWRIEQACDDSAPEGWGSVQS